MILVFLPRSRAVSDHRLTLGLRNRTLIDTSAIFVERIGLCPVYSHGFGIRVNTSISSFDIRGSVGAVGSAGHRLVSIVRNYADDIGL